LAKRVNQHAPRDISANTRQLHELMKAIWNLSTELLLDHICHSNQIYRASPDAKCVCYLDNLISGRIGKSSYSWKVIEEIIVDSRYLSGSRLTKKHFTYEDPVWISRVSKGKVPLVFLEP
jgi:hypothetical protein